MLSIQMKYISATVNGNSFIYVCYMLLVLICLLHINIRFIPLEPSKRERKTQRERETERERKRKRERKRERDVCFRQRDNKKKRKHIENERKGNLQNFIYISADSCIRHVNIIYYMKVKVLFYRNRIKRTVAIVNIVVCAMITHQGRGSE